MSNNGRTFAGLMHFDCIPSPIAIRVHRSIVSPVQIACAIEWRISINLGASIAMDTACHTRIWTHLVPLRRTDRDSGKNIPVNEVGEAYLVLVIQRE